MAISSFGRIRARVIGIAVMLVASLSLSLVQPPPAAALEVRENYYYNYFKSEATCSARGQQLYALYTDIKLFQCYRHAGQTKWSMRVYLDDGTGCRVADMELALEPQRALEPIHPMCA